MRRLWIILGLIVMLLSISAPLTIHAEPAQQDGGLLTNVTNVVSLRAGPGTQWKRLATLQKGTVIKLDGHDPGGLWVRGIIPNGKIGWVASRYVTATADQIFTLPSIWVEAPFTLSAPPGEAAAVAPAAAPTVAPAAPANPALALTGGIDFTVSGRVNIRNGPGTRYKRIGGAEPGIIFRADGRDASGLWVRGITANGVVGWISASFLSGNAVTNLPVVDVNSPFGLGAPGGGNTTSTPPSAPAGPVVNTAPVSGFSYGGHVADFSDNAANWMRQAGMTWAKRQFRYNQGQDPGAVAGLINDAHAKGFRILVGIVGNTWEVNNGGYFDQYAAFVGGVAALGADAIEVWNEQNIDREWPAGSIDAGRYTQLLRQSYQAIKGANPNTLVISGALAPTGFFGGCSANGCDDAPYVSGMAAAGAANYMDCLGAHYNEGIVPPGQTSGDPRNEYFTRYFWGMVNTYTSTFGGSRPLCFTELGYLTPEGFPPLPGGFAWAQNVTLGQQAAWLDDAIALARSSGRVRLVIIWNVDFTNYGDDPMAGFAIIRPGGDCPACRALGS